MQKNKGNCIWRILYILCKCRKLMNILKTTLFIALAQNILNLIALSFFSINLPPIIKKARSSIG